MIGVRGPGARGGWFIKDYGSQGGVSGRGSAPKHPRHPSTQAGCIRSSLYPPSLDFSWKLFLKEFPWAFCPEGFSLRIKEDPHSKNFKGNSYHVIVDNQDLKFYESELSQKWWLELKKNNNNSNIKSLIPCNYQDYLDAKNQKFSERIMLSLKRNFV